MKGIKLLLSKLKGSHALMMAGCVAIMAAFILLPLFGISIGNAGFILLLVICIPMHLFMMKGMHNNHKGTKNMVENSEEKIINIPNKTLHN